MKRVTIGLLILLVTNIALADMASVTTSATAVVKHSPNAFVRMQPRQRATILEKLDVGTVVTILKKSKHRGYTLIRTKIGNEGWVFTKDLDFAPETINDFADSAAQTLDVTYHDVKEQVVGTIEKVSEEPLLSPRVANSSNAEKTIKTLQATIQSLHSQNRQLTINVKQLWFFSGAGILLLGIFLGYFISRPSGRTRTAWGSSKL